MFPLPLLAGVRTAGSVILRADTAAVDGDVSVVARRCAFVSIATWVVCKIAVAKLLLVLFVLRLFLCPLRAVSL